MAAKRGRPRGLNLNRMAFEDMVRIRAVSKQEVCEHAGIGAGHLADALIRGKGVAPAVVRSMAEYLDVDPATLAPQLTTGFVFVRQQDELPEAVGA